MILLSQSNYSHEWPWFIRELLPLKLSQTYPNRPLNDTKRKSRRRDKGQIFETHKHIERRPISFRAFGDARRSPPNWQRFIFSGCHQTGSCLLRLETYVYGNSGWYTWEWRPDGKCVFLPPSLPFFDTMALYERIVPTIFAKTRVGLESDVDVISAPRVISWASSKFGNVLELTLTYCW